MRSFRLGRLVVAAVVAAIVGVAAVSACSGRDQTTPSPSATSAAQPSAASGSPSATTATSASQTPSDILPPPSEPTAPAASTAGALTVRSMPVPAGWKLDLAKGGKEEGYQGNGTPARARDPKYAAFEIISVGCAQVDRSRWTDPTAALEVHYATAAGAPGVGEALQFATPDQALQWFAQFQAQLKACASGNPQVTSTTATATTWVGRRDFGGGEQWAEVGVVKGSLVRLYLLSDASGTVGVSQQNALAASLR